MKVKIRWWSGCSRKKCREEIQSRLNKEEVTSHGLIEKDHSVNAVSEILGILQQSHKQMCWIRHSVRWETVTDVIKKNYRKGYKCVEKETTTFNYLLLAFMCNTNNRHRKSSLLSTWQVNMLNAEYQGRHMMYSATQAALLFGASFVLCSVSCRDNWTFPHFMYR